MYAALLPVNQRIVVGEPAVSKNGGHGLVERSDVEVTGDDFPRRELQRERRFLSDGLVRRTIEKPKTEGRSFGGRNSVFADEVRVDKAMRGTGIYKGEKRSRNTFGVQRNDERGRIGKSGRVETKDRIRVGRFNAVPAARGVRRTAD